MIEFHPFADVWRLFNDEEFAILKADIAAHGQRVPIILYQGKVLDGRNRYRACRELGIEPRCESAKVKSDDDALMLVVSLNEHRRHSSLEERAFAAARLATLSVGNPHRVIVSTETIARAEAAKLMNVSKGSVARARTIINHGTKEDEQAVRNGKLSLAAAAEKMTPKRKPEAKIQSGPSLRQRVQESRDQRARNMKRLTRDEVDPQFAGSGLAFVEKHGHVQLKTAVQKDHYRRLEKLSAITGAIAQMATAAEEILKLPELDDADVDLWFSNSISGNRRLILPKRLDQIERALQRIRSNRLTRPISVVGGTDLVSR